VVSCWWHHSSPSVGGPPATHNHHNCYRRAATHVIDAVGEKGMMLAMVIEAAEERCQRGTSRPRRHLLRLSAAVTARRLQATLRESRGDEGNWGLGF
jgi:hypothetical protein